MTTSEKNKILNAIAQFPDGASIAEIEQHVDLSRRTLQRRLSRLIANGDIAASGAKRSTRYHARLVKLAASGEIRFDATAHMSHRLDLTPAARDVRDQIEKPLQSRMPVGYKRSFLDDYQPNRDYYLDQSVRDELNELGQVVTTEAPAGTYLKKIIERLIIDLSWNSSRLEGNTYSLLETERLLKDGEAVAGKGLAERQMILNHKDAIEMLAQDAEFIGFNRYTICNLHALLSNNILGDPGASGQLRTLEVAIGRSVFEPLNNPHLVSECFEQLLATASAIADPIEQSFFVMVHLPYLQPFLDVNKRTSRLAANISLVQRNLCPLSFIDVPHQDYLNATLAIYEFNEVSYLADVFSWAYRRSCHRYAAVRQSLGEPDPTRLKYREEIRELISEIIGNSTGKSRALDRIKDFSARIPELDRARFREAVETELLSVHEGNSARYRVRPSEFQRWFVAWQNGGA